ncbi:translation initiation factor IF-2-like [Vidua chalybeata]|uniref:translation initiation factor IF-2-like n=1 Tax=Vidua chalybeata TaxID=81927 RepID=UPI0023A8CDDB|nr:translation initiation factor IF-2-like [Vidua chalybeata]
MSDFLIKSTRDASADTNASECCAGGYRTQPPPPRGAEAGVVGAALRQGRGPSAAAGPAPGPCFGKAGAPPRGGDVGKPGAGNPGPRRSLPRPRAGGSAGGPPPPRPRFVRHRPPPQAPDGAADNTEGRPRRGGWRPRPGAASGEGAAPSSPRGGAGGACPGPSPASHLRCAEEPPLRRDPPGPHRTHRPRSAPPGPRSARPAPLRHTPPDLTSLPPTPGPAGSAPSPPEAAAAGTRQAAASAGGGGALHTGTRSLSLPPLPARGMPGAVVPHGTWPPFRAAARGTPGSAVRRGGRHLVAAAVRGGGRRSPVLTEGSPSAAGLSEGDANTPR